MMTRLRCAAGHVWEPAEASAAPLVCPRCGRAPVRGEGVVRETDQTVDMPGTGNGGGAGTALPAAEVTQTMHFTPPPIPPSEAVPMGIELPPGQTIGGSRAESRSAGKLGVVGGAGGAGAMPFAIIRQHARGGLGVVSFARDIHIHREVALEQILPQHVENAVLNRRFLYECGSRGSSSIRRLCRCIAWGRMRRSIRIM